MKVSINEITLYYSSKVQHKVLKRGMEVRLTNIEFRILYH